MTHWNTDMSTAPRDGRPVRIKGLTYIAEDEYEAVAVWTERRCPKSLCEGFFPAADTHDGEGPYEDVFAWAVVT